MFRIFGIQLAVHASFVVLLAYYAYEGWREAGVIGACVHVGLILLFFGCVVLHELGHSLTARRYGVRVPRILLLPIGGMAEFDRIPRRPAEELLITLAGPAVNFVLAALLWPLAGLLPGLLPASAAALAGPVAAELAWANLLMGAFNLLPVFPMDGGRIFRALLALKLPYLRATWWAASVGRALAILLALVAGLVFNEFLLCALFVFIAFVGTAEYRQTLRREQEALYWAEMARRVAYARPPEPPLVIRSSE
ncbi:MAG: site-2 protease family protein [Opitutaceae bacterium]|nr:site-2 protease family protein [Opitutaceae bacterium]